MVMTEDYRANRGHLHRTVDNINRDTGQRYWSGGLKMPIEDLAAIQLPSPL
jgi:hypothetical protein